MIQLLAQLHVAGALKTGVTPDADALFARRADRQGRRWAKRVGSVLSARMPLVNPDAVLAALVPLVRPLCNAGGFLLWLVLVTPAAVLAGMHWAPLTDNFANRITAGQSLLLMWVVFLGLKILHELGHAMLTRVWGGEVHEMGVMIVAGTPVPYVDASTAGAFRSKRRRMAVAAGGMVAELAVAAVSMYVWLWAEPGVVRTLAFDAMLVGGISTVLFNANPLMRLDGYYMLADWLEIPNLRQRASAYAAALVERHVFGSRLATPPAGSASERAWLLLYAVASLAYRPLVVWALFMAVAQRSFALGVVFAAVAGVFWVLAPLLQGALHVLTSPRLRTVRGRAVLVTLALLVGVVGAFGFVPVRYRSRVEGVIWVPEEATVRASADGFVARIEATPGTRVARGDVLVVLSDAELPAQIREYEARLRELDARVDERRPTDAVKAEQLRDERQWVERSLADARRREADLIVRSATDGTFVVAKPDDLPGRYLKKGELIGYAVELDTVTVRAVVAQDRIDLVLRDTQTVHVRLAERLDTPIPGAIRRAVPAASDRLPTAALGSGGGGRIAVDPRDASGTTAMQKLFQVDIQLDTPTRLLNVGGRAYVRFDHGVAPLAAQWYQDVRQLFLTRLGV